MIVISVCVYVTTGVSILASRTALEPGTWQIRSRSGGLISKFWSSVIGTLFEAFVVYVAVIKVCLHK